MLASIHVISKINIEDFDHVDYIFKRTVCRIDLYQKI